MTKGVIQTELISIKGIGEETTRTLLRAFKSVRKIREANANELKAVVEKKARLILAHFNRINS